MLELLLQHYNRTFTRYQTSATLLPNQYRETKLGALLGFDNLVRGKIVDIRRQRKAASILIRNGGTIIS